VIVWVGVSVLLVPVGYFTNSLLTGIVVANLVISALSSGCVLGAATLKRFRVGDVALGVPVFIRRFVIMPTGNRNLHQGMKDTVSWNQLS